jgi:hypothetical protein
MRSQSHRAISAARARLIRSDAIVANASKFLQQSVDAGNRASYDQRKSSFLAIGADLHAQARIARNAC